MTTTAHEDQFTVGTQTIERIREPYNTVSILKQNVADLELALRTQTERAEAAEAELAQARQQKPLTWGTSGELMDILKNPIYSSPAPVPAPAVPELDPMTRLIVSDPKQLKLKKQEPAVPEWPAMLRTRRFIRREAWNPEAFIWFKPGDDRNHSTVMLYTHGKVHAGWIGVHCDHHARDWVYCDDMARALLQSEVTK